MKVGPCLVQLIGMADGDGQELAEAAKARRLAGGMECSTAEDSAGRVLFWPGHSRITPRRDTF